MKKIFISLLVICLLVPFIGTFEVYAEDLKSCGYEVAYINDNGSFSTESCHSDFNAAKNRMKELGGDVVVRHDSSYSYTKIIAMNSGIAYSYPRKAKNSKDGKTMNIYQHVSNRSIHYKQTYVARHFELEYIDTDRYLGDGRGMIETYVNGFHGYADLEYVDLIPSKYLRNGIAITLGGNDPYTGEDFFAVIPRQNYYERKTNGNYSEILYHIYRGYPKKLGSTQEPISETIVIGPAPSEMVEGVKYYSNDGVTFYTDGEFKNLTFIYYNYYQFLPLRSKTNISVDTLNSYLANVNGSVMKDSGQIFVDAQNKYGINALLLFAMACHESANGTSGYAVNRYNLFGWDAVDANPNQASFFSSVADCVNQQAGINLRGFVDITDGRFFSSSLGNKGSGLNVKYASDPYWGMEIAATAYAIDKLSKGKDGTLTDYNAYSLSLINSFDIPVKQSANDSSKTLYTTQYGQYYQEGFIVIDLGSEGSFTKVQSTNPIDENGNIKTHRTPITTGNLNPISYGEYDFDRSIAYINTKYLTVINKKNENTFVNKDLSLMQKINNLSVENNVVHIDGLAFIKGISALDLNNISISISSINNLSKEVARTYNTVVSDFDGISFGDSYTYKYIRFNVDIPLSDFLEGSYSFKVTVNNGGNVFDGELSSTKFNFANINVAYNEMNYRIKINTYYNYRIELEVESIPSIINYNEIAKPDSSIRNSLFSFDKIEITSELNFNIDGRSMIYYTNYDNVNVLETTLYLVDDSNNYYEIDCENYKSDFDYKQALQSSYNLDFISFKGSKNISDIKNGMYSLILKVRNGEFVDYIDLTTAKNIDSTISKDGVSYRIFKSNLKNRIMLEVK